MSSSDPKRHTLAHVSRFTRQYRVINDFIPPPGRGLTRFLQWVCPHPQSGIEFVLYRFPPEIHQAEYKNEMFSFSIRPGRLTRQCRLCGKVLEEIDA